MRKRQYKICCYFIRAIYEVSFCKRIYITQTRAGENREISNLLELLLYTHSFLKWGTNSATTVPNVG